MRLNKGSRVSFTHWFRTLFRLCRAFKYDFGGILCSRGIGLRWNEAFLLSDTSPLLACRSRVMPILFHGAARPQQLQLVMFNL